MLYSAARLAPRTSARAMAPAATRPAAAGVGPGETFSGLIERLEKSGVTYGEHVATSDHAAAGKTGNCPFLADRNNAILRNSAELESNARGYVRKFPLAIEKAEGIMLTDVNGNKCVPWGRAARPRRGRRRARRAEIWIASPINSPAHGLPPPPRRPARPGTTTCSAAPAPWPSATTTP